MVLLRQGAHVLVCFVAYPAVYPVQAGKIYHGGALHLVGAGHEYDLVAYIDNGAFHFGVQAGGAGQIALGRDAPCADKRLANIVGPQAVDGFRAGERVQLPVALSG